MSGERRALGSRDTGRRVGLAAAVLASFGASTACHGALVDEDYRGEPVFQLEGLIVSFPGLTDGGTLRAALFWSLDSTTTVEPEKLVEQRAETEVAFPNQVRLNVFTPPDRGALASVSTPYDLGQVLLYEDLDGDQRLSAGELRGGDPDTVILHLSEPIGRESSPTGTPLPSGYSIASVPFPCGARARTPPPLEETCGVPLGAACERDADCGASGVCLRTDQYFGTFPNGYCVIEAPADCTPSRGVYIPDWTAMEGVGEHGYWFAECASNLDCRSEEGYLCFPLDNACSPLAILLEAYRGFQMAPVCL